MRFRSGLTISLVSIVTLGIIVWQYPSAPSSSPAQMTGGPNCPSAFLLLDYLDNLDDMCGPVDEGENMQCCMEGCGNMQDAWNSQQCNGDYYGNPLFCNVYCGSCPAYDTGETNHIIQQCDTGCSDSCGGDNNACYDACFEACVLDAIAQSCGGEGGDAGGTGGPGGGGGSSDSSFSFSFPGVSSSSVGQSSSSSAGFSIASKPSSSSAASSVSSAVSSSSRSSSVPSQASTNSTGGNTNGGTDGGDAMCTSDSMCSYMGPHTGILTFDCATRPDLCGGKTTGQVRTCSTCEPKCQGKCMCCFTEHGFCIEDLGTLQNLDSCPVLCKADEYCAEFDTTKGGFICLRCAKKISSSSRSSSSTLTVSSSSRSSSRSSSQGSTTSIGTGDGGEDGGTFSRGSRTSLPRFSTPGTPTSPGTPNSPGTGTNSSSRSSSTPTFPPLSSSSSSSGVPIAGGPGCGNGILEANETCDVGNANSDVLPNSCRLNCTVPRCGDSVQDTGEACDYGPYNGQPGSPCLTTCQFNAETPGTIGGIGAGSSSTGTPASQCRADSECSFGEACVRGSCISRSPTLITSTPESSTFCRTNDDCASDSLCVNSLCIRKNPTLVASVYLCGDGILSSPEECDDANVRDFDGCSSSCYLEYGSCGDGVLQRALGEQCEPSLHDSTLSYSCSTQDCRFTSAQCGNGQLDAGEECDAAEQNSNAAGADCRTNCSHSRCGDTVVDPSEQCDDGNKVRGDSCDAFCRIERPSAPLFANGAQVINFPESSWFSFFAGSTQQQLGLAQLTSMQGNGKGQNIPGQTGPAALAIMAAGAGGGLAWMRRKKRN